MAGPFDIDIFDHDIFDCGDVGPGPVEESGAERRMSGRLSLSTRVPRAVKVAAKLSLTTGSKVFVDTAGKLSLTTRRGCVE